MHADCGHQWRVGWTALIWGTLLQNLLRVMVKRMVKDLVFLIRNLEYGAAQRQFVNLARNFRQQDFNATVLFFTRETF